jgi:hypothetical protein
VYTVVLKDWDNGKKVTCCYCGKSLIVNDILPGKFACWSCDNKKKYEQNK